MPWRAEPNATEAQQEWQGAHDRERHRALSKPFVAIDVAGSYRVRKEVAFRPDLAYAALEAAANATEAPPPTVVAGLHWDIAQLFKGLDEAGFDRGGLANLEWVFLEVREHSEYEPKHVTERLVTDPGFFVEVIKLVFRSETEGKAREAGEKLPELGAEQVRYVQHAHRMLMALKRSPGVDDEGRVDAHALTTWVATVRELLAEADRFAIGDQRIGHALWYAVRGRRHPHTRQFVS